VSDLGRLAEAQALIRETGVTVNYILTGRCDKRRRKRSVNRNQHDTEQHLIRRPRQVDGDVYSLIAALSGGQVLNVNENDISELSSLISFSLVQATTTIFYRTSSITPGVYNFAIDEAVSQALISVNGRGISVTVTTPGGKFMQL